MERNNDDFIYDEKKAWMKTFPDMKKNIREWTKEKSLEEFSKQAKKRFAEDKIVELEEMLKKHRIWYIEVSSDKSLSWFLPIIARIAQDDKKRMNKYKTTIEYQNSGRSDFIDDSDIEIAKEYPIQSILEIGHNGRAKCIFHNGTDFNMGIKNNIARCFVCNESGDSIKVYQTVHGCGFIEAVRALS